MSQIDSKQVVRMFEQQLQKQTAKYDDRQFWFDLRATHRDKFGLQDQEMAALDYRSHVERLAAAARCTAFEELVNELGKKMHTEDINMILPALRRAHFKYHGGDVTVNGETLEVFPLIAFHLNVEKKAHKHEEPAANADMLSNAKKPVNKPVVEARMAEAYMDAVHDKMASAKAA